MKESYKHLLNYTANLITLLVEGVLFGLIWYKYYSKITIMETDIIANYHQRGNWAVIGMYILILFFFTKVFGGYKIGYLRVGDIILSNILALFLGNIVAYLELVLITRTYANPGPAVLHISVRNNYDNLVDVSGACHVQAPVSAERYAGSVRKVCAGRSDREDKFPQG